MIFRLKIFIPLVVFVALLALGVYALKGLALETYIESLWPGPTKLQLDSASLDLGGNLTLHASGADLRSDKGLALASFKEMKSSLKLRELGFGSVQFDDIRITGVGIDFGNLGKSKLLETTPKPASGKTTASGEVPVEDDSFQFSDLDHRNLLERVTGEGNLATEKEIEKTREMAKEMEQKWRGLVEQHQQKLEAVKTKGEQTKQTLSSTAREDQIQNRLAQLKERMKTLLGNPPKSVEEIPKIREEVKSMKSEAENLKNELEAMKKQVQDAKQVVAEVKETKDQLTGLDERAKEDLNKLQNQTQKVRQVAKEDVEKLKSELDPKNFDGGKIVRLLFGSEWEEKFRYGVQAFNGFRSMLPDFGGGGKEATVEQQRKEAIKNYQKDRPVPFPRETYMPDWRISLLRLSGLAGGLDPERGDLAFELELRDLSSDRRPEREIPNFKLKSKVGSEGRLVCEGEYDLVQNAAEGREHRYARLFLNGQSLQDKSWGSDKMGVRFTTGYMSLEMDIDLSEPDRRISGEGFIVFISPEFTVRETVSSMMQTPLKNAMQALLAQKIPVRFSASGDDFSMQFGRGVSDAVEEALKESFNEMVRQERDELEKKYRQRIDAKLQSLNTPGEVNTLLKKVAEGKSAGDELQNALSSALKQKLEKQNLVEGEAGELIQQLAQGEGSLDEVRDRIKREAEERARRELEEQKRRLEEEKRKREEEARQKLEAEKQRLEEEKQKREEEARRRAEEEKRKAEEKARQEAEKQKKKLLDKVKLPF